MEKNYDMKHIVFTGPECSGKTTLSTIIAKKFDFNLVTEYARIYLKKINRPYHYGDLLEIAKGQVKLENQQIKKNNSFIVCDTNLQVIKIWSQVKYNKCDSFIIKNENKNALYILCKPDFKWVHDPMRENPTDRNHLFKLYKKDLIQHNRNYIITSGSIEKRIQLISDVISKLSH